MSKQIRVGSVTVGGGAPVAIQSMCNTNTADVAATVSQILAAAASATREVSESSLVKLTLTGTFTLETQKDLDFLKKMMEGKFWFLKVKDESRLKIEKETYEHDISLKGEFIRLVMASDKTDEEKEQMIFWGIRALSGEEVAL